VHYHTDCPWFAGCENMLANLLNDPDLRQHFQVSLSYRASPAYAAGLARRTLLDYAIYPLRFPEPSAALPAPSWLPGPIRRAVRFASRQFATYPLLAYEIWLLRRLFMRIRPDVVHINNGGYPAALSARAAAIAARSAGVPRVVMVVNNLAERAGAAAAGRAFVDRWVVGAVSQFVTGSSAASAQLRLVLGLPEAQSVAYPNGIAERAPSETREATLARLGVAPTDGTVFAVVALMEERKGHRVLMEALASLLDRRDVIPPLTVLLEGDGPLRGELEALARARGLGDRCRFIGTEANVMNLMQAIDVLVLPSVAHEDFPNVILEAMALGKPVIASRLAGTPEQVEEGVTGLLVSPGSRPELAAAMVALASDRAQRDRLGREARRTFDQHFRADVAVGRYKALYQSLIAQYEP
jgi:glycosyltransferase involved in cell wall biosynthesis